jgi:outer membrane protein
MNRVKLTLMSFVAATTLQAIASSAYAADMNAMVYKAPPAPAVDPWSPWQLRLRALAVLPDAGSSTINVVGAPALSSPNSGIKIDNSVVPELDISYFLNPNWSVEVVLGVTPHKITGTGTLANLDIGKTWLLPPTATLQYHFTNFGAFQPYVGAGVNYTVFFNQSAGNTALGALPAITGLSVHNAFGAAFQAGFDYMIDRHWGLNFDAKWLYLQPNFTATDTAGLPINGNAHINPWLIGGGITYRL